jgi:hypothetical protein
MRKGVEPKLLLKAGKCSITVVDGVKLKNRRISQLLAGGRCRTAEDTVDPLCSCRKRVCRRRFDRWNPKIAALAASNSFARKGALLLLLFCILLSGCRFRQSTSGSSIQLEGSSRRGRRSGQGRYHRRTCDRRSARTADRFVRPELNTVVQPLVGEPFTKIRSDSTWTNSTHLGTESAA